MPSFSNQLLLFFRSDESSSARGFEVFWDGTAQGKDTKEFRAVRRSENPGVPVVIRVK